MATAASFLFDLRGRVALITGASGGIGRAIATVFAAQGCDLVLSDRDAAAVEAVAAECRQTGVRAQTHAADLADPAAADSLGAAALRCFGPIDVLVCNAGIQPLARLDEITPAEWDRVMQVNLRSAHALCAALAPAMAERGGGSIILMSSILALRGAGGLGLYAMSKAALSQLARTLAVEWGPRGVRANAIAPGLIRSPLTERFLADPAFVARRMAQTPLRRAGEPEEVAGVAAMLASAAGAFMTGQTLVVDGGTLIGDGT